MQAQVRQWFERRTSALADWPLAEVLAAKQASGTTVSVVLPALDEDATVGAIVAAIRHELLDRHPLVDELIVVDSGSSDRTAAVAAEAGARVVHRDAILPRLPAVGGKGEVLWRSLLVSSGDLVVFIDADLERFRPEVVVGLLGPLLADPGVELVKGLYDRPLVSGESVLPAGGGRVTELVARPLLNLHWPELAGVVQPLAGEYAARRTLLEQLPFPCGYGVEIALLIDTLALSGLDAIGQVDLGTRHHRHQDDAALGRMAAQIWQAGEARLGRDVPGRAHPAPPATLTQFTRVDGEVEADTHDVTGRERPPVLSLPEYRAHRSVLDARTRTA
ncbi:glucosyl-3-phosphoglycerate synthase [Sporichthya sp.]|uniref:glucosyl-3-phosphoglycerate synthase n=1 Tax=Sporichthya sp. TaxID=65475 RepID=UPI00178F4446|nr:glucosyl-3-phosphoglycerate synthase [Sporichthya sp.]MBA3743013.1 glucosyl-3-phosphoglycerate synthase [Sporichthya sp.]